MNVNITLCFQCINFFITYIFLRYVLFKPVMHVIKNEEGANEQVRNEIAQQELYIMEQFHLRQLNWQEFKKHCQFNKPQLQNDADVQIQLPNIPPKSCINTLLIETTSSEYAKIIVEHLKQKNRTL